MFILYERRRLKNWIGFNIEFTKEQTLFKNVAIFDFESFCVPS